MANWDEAQGPLCPQCKNDPNDFSPKDPAGLASARQAFKEKATGFRPDGGITLWDKWRPWMGVVLGFVLFMFWLRACSTHGWRIW
jgi:hypothetical protein